MPSYKTKSGGKIKTVKPIPKTTQKILGMKNTRKKAAGGAMKSIKKKAKKGPVESFANDTTRALPPRSENKAGPKGFEYKRAGGGKLKMVEKDGKKVPFFAADGVGKMAKGGSVKIKSGDTLSQIAKSKGISLKALLAANPSIKNANKIRVGQSIRIPGAEAGKAAKTSNPYKGMTKTQMSMMDVKNKDRGKQESATRSLITQSKMGTGMTPSKAAPKRKSDKMRESALERARAKAKAKSSAKKASPKRSSGSMSGLRDGDVAAKSGGMMKKAKAYKYGGTVRGAGAATRGKKFGRCG